MKPFAASAAALAVAAFLSLLPATDARAADEVNVSSGLTLAGAPLGLHGFDPVAMFASEAPRLGVAAHTARHEGVDYYFANAETKARFEADPEAYLPRYGGYCAFGVALGKKLDGDVRYADIVDGELFLFVNEAVFEKYLEDKLNVLTQAKAKWVEIRSAAVEDL